MHTGRYVHVNTPVCSASMYLHVKKILVFTIILISYLFNLILHFKNINLVLLQFIVYLFIITVNKFSLYFVIGVQEF